MAAKRGGGGSKGGGGGGKKAPMVITGPNPRDNQYPWANTQGGKVISEHRKKEPAVARGEKEAKADRTEHQVRRRDGTIQNPDSHGNDPNPPKDKKS